MSRTRKNILRTMIGMMIFASSVTCLLAQDTTNAPFGEISTDTLRTADTIRVMNPMIPSAGVLDRSGIHAFSIADSEMSFMDYRSLYDIMGALPGVILNDPGSPGQFAGISMDGGDAFSTMFYADGVPLNDPITGQFDLHLYPVENIERIEIIRGPMAAGFGPGAAGDAINFVSKNKTALTPYSHIRYSESGHGYSYFDGMASQDVFRRFNVTLGAGHQTTLGRFTNSDFDLWSGRAKLRYNIDHRLNLFASIMYTRSQRGLNGGIDLAATPDPELRFDGQQAIVVNGDAYEKNSRYDLQVGGLGRFFEDTLNVTTLTMFLTTNLREYRDEENRSGSNGIFVSQDHRSISRGVALDQHLRLGELELGAGSTIQTIGTLSSDLYGRNVRTRIGVHANATWYLGQSTEYSAFIRHYKQADLYFSSMNLISSGMELAFYFKDRTRIHAGAGGGNRLCSLIESSPVSDTIGYSSQTSNQHYSYLEAGVSTPRGIQNGVDIRIFVRSYHPTISTYPLIHGDPDSFLPSGRIPYGLSGLMWLAMGSFRLELSAMAIGMDEEWRPFTPAISGTASITFHDKLFSDHLELETGLRMKGHSAYTGMEYISTTQIFVPGNYYATRDDLRESVAGGTIDFILIGHIGKAYVHLIWENLLDRKYVTTYYYPMPERNLRFGISWEFEN